MDDSKQHTLASSSSPPTEAGEISIESSSLSVNSGLDSEGKDSSKKMDTPKVPTQNCTTVGSECPKEETPKAGHAVDNALENSSTPAVQGEDDSNTVSPMNTISKSDSSQCNPSQENVGIQQDNVTASLDSSPTTPSTSGQDSGVSLVSPDDSSCDAANKSPESFTSTDKSKGDTGLNDTVKVQSVDSSIEKDLLPQVSTSSFDQQNSASNTMENVQGATAGVISSDQVSVYYIKWVLFGTNKVPIITQNENGPCPLLAIMNVLLLKGKVTLAPMLEMVTSEQLMAYLADCIFENMPENLPAVTKANYEQNMQDAMGVMDKLQTGLDVNVRFTGTGDFEYTRELIVFDLLEISLYHGWLVDPQDASTVQAVNQCSYNQLVEKIISLKQSSKEEDVTNGLIAEQFLDRTASQLTYHGLCELSSIVKDSELCVFFRNNHFNTLYKHNNELFLLVTDQGFLTENNVVWETLSNVDGDGHFVDGAFRTYTRPSPPTQPIPDPTVPVGSPEQIDHDYQVALSLQEEDVPAPATDWPVEQDAAMLADHEYAVRLQEQENQRAAQEQQRVAPFEGQAAGGQAPQAQGRPQAQNPSQSDSQRRRPPERPERREKEKSLQLQEELSA